MAIPTSPPGISAYSAAGTRSFAPSFLGKAGSAGSVAARAGSAGSVGSAAAIAGSAGSGAKPFTSELDGEYTCEEVVFEITDRIIARVYGFKPDPNAPAPQAFIGNADRPLEGINLAGAGSGAGGPTSPAGEINTKILQAALAAYNEKMDTSAGPEGGNKACAWAVNKIMARAGLKPIGVNPNLVSSLEQDLAGGRGQLVSPRTAMQGGDIVIMGSAHVGIAIGPDKIISNSSRKAKFIWPASLSGYDSYYKTTCKVYRVVR